jgi:beta-glucosidase
MPIDLPSSFRFGICDADLQVIGEKFTTELEGAETTMWAAFAKKSNNGTPELGIDRYHRWKDDIEIMQKIGIKHYRTSVAINRILKKNGDVNPKAIDWYTQYFRALKKTGINIYVTLYHWELSQYLNEQGGWKNPKTIEYLIKHADAVAQNLGEYIEEYFILNEPWCSSILSYYFGIHAPGEKSLKNALLAAHNLLLSLGMVYRVLSSIDKNMKISSTFNTEPAYAASVAPKDILAAKYADGYFNRWFMDPIFLGKYPDDMVELYGNNMPRINKEDMRLIKVGDKLHAFGLQYYRGQIAKYNDKSAFRFDPVIKKGGLTNDLGWPIFLPPLYQEGLYDMLGQIYYSYRDYGLKRIYVT